MPEWLNQTLSGQSDLSATEMAVRLAVACLCGLIVAGVYQLVRPRSAIAPTFPATLVLLTILCAMLPQIIGENVAWAFGLVGALSIVRFRTVIEDTKDISFVIVSVLVGMAVGAGRLQVAAIGIPIVGFAAFLMKPRGGTTSWASLGATLSVRIGVGRKPEAVVRRVFETYLKRFDLVSGSVGRQGASLDLKYDVELRSEADPTELIDELNRLEGVQGVELRRR